jgi:hypothetical protein
MTADLAHLRTKPWSNLEREVVSDITLPKGYIADEERRSYHYLARYCIKGQGHIVDAGAYIGASAYCFASGLARNSSKGKTVIHAYDRFLVDAAYIGEMITKNFRPLNSDRGDDFFDIFEFQVGKYKEFIHSHRGDFLLEKWNGEPIELLFVDLAKNDELHKHIVEQFYPSLIPGRSLLIHQDFYHPWHPYIHISMQYLKHKFEIIDPFVHNSSRLYLLKDRLTADEIAHVNSVPQQERLDLLEEFIDGEEGDMRAMGHVIKMCQHWLDKDQKGFQAQRSRLAAEFEWQPHKDWAFWCAELDKVQF